MSGVLTLALESMKQTVDALKEAGVRDEVKVIIGGNRLPRKPANRSVPMPLQPMRPKA